MWIVSWRPKRESIRMTKSHAPRLSHAPHHAVILSHPAERSFNGAVAKTYCDAVRATGQTAELRDLYRLGFDPILRANERPGTQHFTPSADVLAELKAIKNADVFVLVYPLWFATPPAMMKGYVERVFGAGFSFRSVHTRKHHEPLSGKHLLSITTSGTSWPWLNEQGAWRSFRNLFGDYIANAFSMASSDNLHLANIVPDMTERSVREELCRVKQKALATCTRVSRSVWTSQMQEVTADG